jgi:hypothetical protein
LNAQGDKFHVELSGSDGSIYTPSDDPKLVNKAPEPEPKFVRPNPLPLLYAGGIFIFLILAYYYYSGTP